MDYPWHFLLMTGIYIIAGIFHFIKPTAYLRIMPRYLPQHKRLVYLSGAAELVLGIALLFEETKALAIYGIILMLLIFIF